MLHSPQTPTIARPHARVLTGEATLHVCTLVTNPVRYQSRYKLFDGFRSQTEGAHVEHWTAEIAYGNRPFVVTERDNPHHMQLRTQHEVWHKENALNLLFAYVLQQAPDAEYLAWVDADIAFTRPDWAYETLQQLQHFDVVQMFSYAQDVGPKFEPIGSQQIGLLYAYYNGIPAGQKATSKIPVKGSYYGNGYGHPGYAWAARRSALDALGGLLDVCILGSADHHMAMGLIGQMGPTIHGDLRPEFRAHIERWGERADRLVRRNVGYVDGLISHNWHGRKRDRRYSERWKILIENGYTPDGDLRRDTQGLWQLTERSIKLRDDIRSYFRSRNEDSIAFE